MNWNLNAEDLWNLARLLSQPAAAELAATLQATANSHTTVMRRSLLIGVVS